MFKLTECHAKCTCEECKENCEWAGKQGCDFTIVNKKGSTEFYKNSEYLETPIPIK